MGTISTYPAALTYGVAWNAGALQSSPPAAFTDITARVLRQWQAQMGRQYELARTEAGTWRPPLDNRDGALDPNNAASPFAPNVVPYRQTRIRAQVGVNLLTLDQATAGEGTGFLGAIPPRMNVVNDFSYPVSIVASGSAYQGTQVYQAVLPNGAPQFATVLMVQQQPVIPSQWYAYQAQVRITAGNSVTANAAILWYDQNGNPLTPAGGATISLVSGAGTWSELAASWQAPLGAYSAALKIELLAALTAQTTFQLDGLQFEQSQTATPFQLPGTIPANLLPRAVATGTASINPVNDSAATWFYPAIGSVAQATFLTAAPNGQTTALAWTTPTGTTGSFPLYAGVANALASPIGPVEDCVQVTAALPYTFSLYLMRAASADATVQVTASCRWFDINGNLISATTGTAATVTTSGWTRATVTNATAPTGAVWCRARIAITSPASTTATNVIYAAAWQFEQGAAASTWMDPGPRRGIFRGFIEQLPQAWELSGTWTKLDAIMTDALGGLGTGKLPDPFVAECLALAPSFLYKLDDTQGASFVVDAAGNCPPGQIAVSPAGTGSLALGSGISGGRTFQGTPGPVALLANTPSAAAQSPLTYIQLPAPATTPNYGLTSGSASGSTPFTRMIAFQASANPAAAMYLWSATMPTFQSPQPTQISIYLDTSGHLNITLTQSGTYTQTYSSQSYADGNWHLVSVGADNVNGFPRFSIDGVTTDVSSGFYNPTGMTRDSIGARAQDGTNGCTGGASASIALAVQWPVKLSAAQISNLYNSWLTASSGESSGARIQRVLTWVGWTGATAIDTGATTDMGPATDLAGLTALDALNTVTATENGNVFASADGAITFKARTARYNQSTPKFIFGERTKYGEWPYDESARFPVDPVHTYNDVEATQYSVVNQYTNGVVQTLSNGQVATAISAASEQQNFQRTLPVTINAESFTEVQEAAAYLLGQYQTPTMRCSNLVLYPSRVPGLFNVCLQLEQGTRMRAMRRASGSTIQFDGFVERIAWTLNPKSGDVSVTLECSPANRASYWTLAALHTTLQAQAASGQNQATIYALPDSAVNMLSQSLPAGYQLTFDPGMSNAETMTIAPGGIPATNPGYTQATLTFTSNFAHTHGAGAIVCEPLPAGYTDPTMWDAGSVIGAASAQLPTGATSGTNTILVGPLPDAAANPAASDWNVGDLLQIGVGTANFEGYNLLPPNVSTAGEGVLPLTAGTTGLGVGITGGLGTPVVTASGSAWQGSNVWQTSVAANAATPNGLLYLQKACLAAPLLPFTASIYTRSATTGANPQVYLYIEYLDVNGNSLSFTQSSNSTLTGSPSAAYTRLTVTATAPAGAVWVQVGVVLTGTSPSIAWSWQGDGLQVEQSATARAYQTCPQILSVPIGAPGYTTCLITLANNLANSHAVNEIVCDPLPPAYSSPAALPATARLAY